MPLGALIGLLAAFLAGTKGIALRPAFPLAYSAYGAGMEHGHGACAIHPNQEIEMADMSNGFGMGNTTGQGFGMSGGKGSSDDWKSDAFVNMMLPGKDGQLKKFGAVGLKLSNKRQKELIERFQKDPEGMAKLILSKLVIQFRMAEQGEGDAFDL